MDWIIGRALRPETPDPGEPRSRASGWAWAMRGNPEVVIVFGLLMLVVFGAVFATIAAGFLLVAGFLGALFFLS